MKKAIAIILIWLFLGGIGSFLLADQHRQKFGCINIGDIVVLSVFATFGPFNLSTAGFFYAVEYIKRHVDTKKCVWPK